MKLLSDLPRRRVHEIMDGPDLPEPEHRAALAGLAALNRISRTAQSYLPHIVALAARLKRRELQLLDVACGGGDVPLALAQLAKKHGIELHLTLLDRSAVALQQAGALAAAGGINCQTVI